MSTQPTPPCVLRIPATPRAFLRRERRLLATLTPAWCEARIAAREGTAEAPSPPLARRTSRPPARPQQILDAIESLPEPMTLEDIQRASGIPMGTMSQYICRLREKGLIRKQITYQRYGKGRTKPCPTP